MTVSSRTPAKADAMRRTGFTAYLPILAMALVAGLTYWLLRINLPPAPTNVVEKKTHRPDYFADNFSITMLDETGTTQYRINAAKMIHYEDDDYTDLTVPAIRAFSPNQPIVTATALRGVINGDGSIVDLYDSARVLRAAGGTDPAMQADSEHFRVFVNDDVVKTEKTVKLQRGQSIMTANGMIYNNVTREIRLLGNVRGTIAPADSHYGGPSR
jgi:lipopolysaccharide export system protein LptC